MIKCNGGDFEARLDYEVDKHYKENPIYNNQKLSLEDAERWDKEDLLKVLYKTRQSSLDFAMRLNNEIKTIERQLLKNTCKK